MVSKRIQRQIDRLLNQAEEAITSEDWATVGARVRSVLAIDRPSTDAMTHLAAAQRALGAILDSAPPIGSTSTGVGAPDTEQRRRG